MLDYVKSALQVLVQLTYFVLLIVTKTLQAVLHRLNGVHIHRQGVVSQSESTCVVDVNHVITKLPFLGMSIADYFHFLTWHHKFETLDYLLKPNITLYFMDNQNAVFLEHKLGDNIYDTKKYPFFFMAQRFTAVKVLIVPLNQLPALAQKLNEPLCEVTWLCHMARCGSTTVVQGLNAIPNCVVISESQDIMRHITAVYKSRRIEISDYVKTEAFKEYFRFSVRYTLRSFSAEQHVCLKTTASFAYQIFGSTAELFPSHRFISMHRDGQGTAKSFWKMGNSHTLLRFGIWTMRKFPTLSQVAYKDAMVVFTNGLQSEVMDMYSCREITLFLFFYMQWVTNMVTFQRYKSSVKDLLMLCYDDFQGDKKGSMMKIMSYMGISLDHLPSALEAMEGDSQAGTPLGWDVLQGLPTWQRDERTVELCNELLTRFNLPSFDQKFRFNANREIEIYN